MTTPETLDPETIARCRARLDYCRRSDNGYEVREGEFWAPLVLAYDAAQDIAAHLYRERQELQKKLCDGDMAAGCLEMIRETLQAIGCKHGPDAHKSTPPMMYPEWIVCVVASATEPLKAAAETEAMFASELNAHVAELKAEVNRLRESLRVSALAAEAEVDRLQSLLRASAERIAGQSELLSRRAEVK